MCLEINILDSCQIEAYLGAEWAATAGDESDLVNGGIFKAELAVDGCGRHKAAAGAVKGIPDQNNDVNNSADPRPVPQETRDYAKLDSEEQRAASFSIKSILFITRVLVDANGSFENFGSLLHNNEPKIDV